MRILAVSWDNRHSGSLLPSNPPNLFSLSLWTEFTLHPPLASGSEVFHPLYELHQLHQLRHPKVRATPGCLQERIEKPSRVRPLQGNRHQLTGAVPAVHTLPAPAAPVADQLELFGKPRMEGMRERESLFQVIYEGCNSNVILSPAKEGSMSIRGSWTISTERLRVLELPKPRRGLRSLSTTQPAPPVRPKPRDNMDGPSARPLFARFQLHQVLHPRRFDSRA